MGPVPEPDHSGRVSDEEIPRHPPILQASSDEDDDDPMAEEDNGYPPGYMPITQHMEIQWPSDSEDIEDADPRDLAVVSAQSSTAGSTLTSDTYRPADGATALDSYSSVTASGPEHREDDNCERAEGSDDAIDYSSVSGLMAALQAHGPTVVEDRWGLSAAYRDYDREPGHETATGVGAGQANDVISEEVKAGERTGLEGGHVEDKAAKEDRLPLAPEQEEAVLQAMRGFVLPASAIPPWATNVRDSDLTAILKDKTSKRT